MKSLLKSDIFKNKLKIFYKEKKTMNNDCFLELLCEMICMRPVSRDINVKAKATTLSQGPLASDLTSSELQ